MKKILLVAACIVGTVGTLAQGTINFSNRVTAAGVDAPVADQAGAALEGDAWKAQLMVGADVDSMAPVGDPISFLVKGYYKGGNVTTELAGGSEAKVMVRVWEAAAGADYDTALGAGGQVGESNMLTLTLGGDTSGGPATPPVNLVGLEAMSVAVIPEPTTIALGLLGAAVLLLRRRK